MRGVGNSREGAMSRASSTSVVLCLIGFGNLLACRCEAAPQPNLNLRVQEAQKDLKQAKDKLTTAEKQFQTAQKSHNDAEAKEKAAMKSAVAVRQKVQERLEKAAGVEALVTESKGAQTDYDKIRNPLIEALKKTPDYQKASTEGTAAMTQLKEVRSQKGLTEKERKSMTAGLNEKAMKPGKFEQAAIDADPKAKAAREALEAVQKKLNAAREKIKKDVEADRETIAAAKSVDDARAESKKTSEALARESLQLEQAREHVAAVEQRLQSAQAALVRKGKK